MKASHVMVGEGRQIFSKQMMTSELDSHSPKVTRRDKSPRAEEPACAETEGTGWPAYWGGRSWLQMVQWMVQGTCCATLGLSAPPVGCQGRAGSRRVTSSELIDFYFLLNHQQLFGGWTGRRGD